MVSEHSSIEICAEMNKLTKKLIHQKGTSTKYNSHFSSRFTKKHC